MIALTPIEISQTCSSGAWSFNTMKFSGGDLRQIVLSPATETTTYNLTITDEKNNIVLDISDITGSYGNDPDDLLYLPLRGIYTIAVDTCSVTNEVFTGRLMIEE